MDDPGGFVNDVMYGGDGNNTICAGDHNDTLYGGTGADRSEGGADMFAFIDGDGSDAITDV